MLFWGLLGQYLLIYTTDTLSCSFSKSIVPNLAPSIFGVPVLTIAPQFPSLTTNSSNSPIQLIGSLFKFIRRLGIMFENTSELCLSSVLTRQRAVTFPREVFLPEEELLPSQLESTSIIWNLTSEINCKNVWRFEVGTFLDHRANTNISNISHGLTGLVCRNTASMTISCYFCSLKYLISWVRTLQHCGSNNKNWNIRHSSFLGLVSQWPGIVWVSFRWDKATVLEFFSKLSLFLMQVIF